MINMVKKYNWAFRNIYVPTFKPENINRQISIILYYGTAFIKT